MTSRRRRPVIPVLALLLVCVAAQLATVPLAAADGTALVSAANRDRATVGKGSVADDALLDRISDDRARQMAASDVLAHDLPYVVAQLRAAGACFSAYGEIIAWESGYAMYDPSRTMAQWWASAGHHAIIVGDFNAAGGSHARRPGTTSEYSAMVWVRFCTPPTGRTSVTRLAGADRYETAAAISRARFASASVVFVATGTTFPDALAGAAAAAHEGAPVLLTRPDLLSPAALAELTRLHPGRIVLLGGTAAVAGDVEAALARLAPVIRLAGRNRYATAAAISARTFGPGVPVAYVATGESFPDALAGGALAGRDGGPVLLVTRASVPPETAAELARLRPARIVVLGGSAAVSDAVLAALQPNTTSGAVARLGGADRYDTSVLVSRSAYGGGAAAAFVATGRAFPEGRAIGPVAALVPGPLLLVRPGALPSTVGAELERLAPDAVFVLGSTGAVSEAVVAEIEAILP